MGPETSLLIQEGEKPLALPGIDPWFVGNPACSLDIIPATVFQLPATTNVMKTEHSRYWGIIAWDLTLSSQLHLVSRMCGTAPLLPYILS